MNINQLSQSTWDIFRALCPIPSVSASPAEGAIAQEIHQLLAKLPLFQENSCLLKSEPVPGAAHARVVTALVPGSGGDTVIFLNHHDVVDIGDYGPLRELAFQPYELTAKMDSGLLPPAAREDLLSGEWLFGRGVMDMKFGLAMQLALAIEYASNPPARGNLLFLSVPDEENNSAGMRHAVSILRRYQEQYNLNYIAAINSEPQPPQEQGLMVQTGSDGKMLALICCYGLVTHVGELFDGLNSHLLLAEITRLLELNPGFADSSAGEHTMPPTLLMAGDLREGYSVTTPRGAYGFFNISALSASPGDILTKLVTLCSTAMTNALEKLERSRNTWAARTGELPAGQGWQVKVLTYQRLWELCLEHHGRAFQEALDAFVTRERKNPQDNQAFALAVLDFVHGWCPDRDPKIILAFAPPFYPPVLNQGQTSKEIAILEAVSALAEYARIKHNLAIRRREFHRGISDLSYCSLLNPEAVSRTLTENSPGWGSRYDLPLLDIAQLDAPALNLGPVGRDFHKIGERLYLPSAQILPDLLAFLTERLLNP